MFWSKKNKAAAESGMVYATQDGEILPIERMPDSIFADKILGDGICILPENGKVYSPVTGVVDSVAEAGHAYGLIADGGAEIMVHIGVDTVKLEGEGFQPKVSAGQRVEKGDILCEVDLNVLQTSGLSAYTAVLLTNLSAFCVAESFLGQAAGGKSKAFRCEKKQ